MSLDHVLFALSDPTRRQVLEHIRLNPESVGKIANHLPVSRPAVSQHLKVLKEAGLVSEKKQGTRNIYSVDPAGISILRDYFNDYWGSAWIGSKPLLKKQINLNDNWQEMRNERSCKT